MQKFFIAFCFSLLSVVCLQAQNPNPKHYKYIDNLDASLCYSVLEINNYYYMISGLVDSNGYTRFISVFDENFGKVEDIHLSDNGVTITPSRFFYEQDTFYVFGWKHLPNHGPQKCCLAKYDKDFNLLQPISTFLHSLDDMLEYESFNVLKTKNNEFILHLSDMYTDSRVLHINRQGDILQDVLLTDAFMTFSFVETDSNYVLILDFDSRIVVFNKDSLAQYEYVHAVYAHLDDVLVVNNRILQATSLFTKYSDCLTPTGTPIEEREYDNVVYFLDDSFQIKHRLEIGFDCMEDEGGAMGYLNPDSIYLAYSTLMFYDKDEDDWQCGIGIACFNSEGQLHFNYLLDVFNTKAWPFVWSCEVLSNGGVLIAGGTWELDAFLLYFHPTEEVNGVKEIEARATSVQVFPNPAHTQFTVTNAENATITMYNLVGQKVKQVVGKAENMIIHTEDLPAGMYILKVENGNGVVAKKVQVVK